MEKRILVTHNGSFHADEVFATAAIKMMLGPDFELEVIRSREPEDWAKGDYVVDVGGVYDSSKQRFDHHQEGGAGGRADGIDYSSLGLVWKEYGEILCGNKEAADIIDKYFVRAIDANDNGIQISVPNFPDLEVYSINSVIAEFHPGIGEHGVTYNEAFMKALDFSSFLLERIIIHARGQVEGRKIIREMVSKQKGQQVVEIDHNYPWEEVLVTEFPDVLYVIYHDADEKWRLKAVRQSLGLFACRKPLPEAWGGKTDKDLQDVTGVEDALFCHRKLFTCGAGSKEGVLELAKLALEN